MVPATAFPMGREGIVTPGYLVKRQARKLEQTKRMMEHDVLGYSRCDPHAVSIHSTGSGRVLKEISECNYST
jgi:hypothetical protein